VRVCSQLEQLRARALNEQRVVAERTKRKAAAEKSRNAKRQRRADPEHKKSPTHACRRSPSRSSVDRWHYRRHHHAAKPLGFAVA